MLNESNDAPIGLKWHWKSQITLVVGSFKGVSLDVGDYTHKHVIWSLFSINVSLAALIHMTTLWIGSAVFWIKHYFYCWLHLSVKKINMAVPLQSKCPYNRYRIVNFTGPIAVVIRRKRKPKVMILKLIHGIMNGNFICFTIDICFQSMSM